MRAPVVVVLHHLERPFTGHAGRVLRAAGVTLDERDLSGEGFRSGPCAWGIQFHPEVDAHALED